MGSMLQPLPYAKYRSSLIFWYLIDRFYSKLYLRNELDELGSALNYSERLQLYIRTKENALIERNMSIVNDLQQDVYTCESFSEFRDVAEIINDIEDDFI